MTEVTSWADVCSTILSLPYQHCGVLRQHLYGLGNPSHPSLRLTLGYPTEIHFIVKKFSRLQFIWQSQSCVVGEGIGELEEKGRVEKARRGNLRCWPAIRRSFFLSSFCTPCKQFLIPICSRYLDYLGQLTVSCVLRIAKFMVEKRGFSIRWVHFRYLMPTTSDRMNNRNSNNITDVRGCVGRYEG